MPSVPISFREVKEPVDSGWPYLKSSTRKGKKGKAKKVQKPKGEKKPKYKKKEGTSREEW